MTNKYSYKAFWKYSFQAGSIPYQGFEIRGSSGAPLPEKEIRAAEKNILKNKKKQIIMRETIPI